MVPRSCLGRFQWGGFVLGYCGPLLGVHVTWYPRDPFTVWIVKLIEGAFPPRTGPTSPEAPLNYFDQGDVEVLCGRRDGPRAPELYEQYGLPTKATVEAFAGILRDCGAGLLRGDLTLLPALEQRIRDRARRG